MPKPTSSLVFSRLFLPHPLPADRVEAFLTRLASDRRDQPVILETRASSEGIVHLVGCDATYVQELRRLLGDLIPGTLMTGLDGYVRNPLRTSGTVKITPVGLPLNVHDPERISRALYSTLSRRFQPGEEVVLQVLLGPGIPPRQVPPKIAPPGGMGVWQALTKGKTDAPNEIRNAVRDRAAQYGIDCTIRIGVNAVDDDKRRRLGLELLAGLRLAESAGTSIRLYRDQSSTLNTPSRPRSFTAHLAVSELVPLSGWPLGADPLPGMPPAHPKLLRAESKVSDGPLAIATSLVPGDNRSLGISFAAAMHHLFALGPTGVGKTTMLEHLMATVIEAGHAALILDPKDQTPAALLPRIPKERWADVYEINAADEHPNGFNPFDPGDRDPDVQADSILAVFEKVFIDLGPRTSDILSASVRTLLRTGTPEKPNTIVDLPRLWTDATFRRVQAGKIAGDVTLAGFWAWYESLKPAAQMSVVAPVMNRLRQILLRPGAVKILGQRRPAFRLRDIFRDRKIVIVPLNEALIGPMTANLIGGLIMAEAWQATQERASEEGHQKRPGFVFVDEADRFMNGTLTVSLADALARSRSLSVGWALSTQYWDQLPKEMKSAIKSNARTKVIYRLEDEDDARTIAKLAPDLEPLDFMSLGKYEVYLRLLVDGITTGWALGKTLPPVAGAHKVTEVRRASREHHQPVPFDHENLVDVTPGLEETEPPPDLLQPAPGPLGRRRRQP